MEKVLGIMSGTSLDGVDYAICSISKNSICLEKFWSVKFSSKLENSLRKAANNKLSSYQLGQLNHDLGRFYANNIKFRNFDYVGLHGQTVFHHPEKNREATTQIGEPSYIASKFSCPVYSNFRSMDMAEGGQGAPLAPLFHVVALSSSKFSFAINNIGGISNVTYLPKGSALKPGEKIGSGQKNIISFDTGPGNMLIDLFVKKVWGLNYDKGGKLAAQGIPSQLIINKWLQHSYFKQRPPKSTGRELFGSTFFEKHKKDLVKLSKLDQLATITYFTAASIAKSYFNFLPEIPDKVVLCGGGSQNRTLQKSLAKYLNQIEWTKNGSLRKIEVISSDELGWASQSIEASAFALLAYRSKHGLAGNLPSATGARRPVVLGQCTNPAG